MCLFFFLCQGSMDTDRSVDRWMEGYMNGSIHLYVLDDTSSSIEKKSQKEYGQTERDRFIEIHTGIVDGAW